MRQAFKNYIERYLRFLARCYIRATKPIIIGVTGSFGKTSAKEAIYHALQKYVRVRRTKKSLNTEIGMALGILGLESGFSSIFRWLAALILGTLRAFLFSGKCDVLILEYGADKPGDIDKLLSIAKPHIAVITGIGQAHLDDGQFKNTDAVFEEKKKLAACVPHDGLVIINGDDPYLQKLAAGAPKKTYGTTPSCDAYATNIKQSIRGTECLIHVNDKQESMRVPVLGAHHVGIFLAAILVGLHLKADLFPLVSSLRSFHLPPGRMNLIEGIAGSTIIDSSYNASPSTMKSALTLLKELSAKRKIAVLGNMNELGADTEAAHRELGAFVSDTCEVLITVGRYASLIAEEALKSGFLEDRIKTLDTAEAAGVYLRKELREGDLVLFKGSQNNVRLEKAIIMVMRHPEKARSALCRQEKEWSRIS